MVIQTHNSEMMRECNQSMLYNLIRTVSPISRAMLARMTGMSPTSIGRIVSVLVAGGYIREIGVVNGNIGRKATLLEAVPEGILAIGVCLEVHRIEVGLVDIQGNILKRVSCKNSTALTQKEVIENVQSLIDQTISLCDKKIVSKICGVGVSVPGPVDWESGTLLYSPQLKWQQVNLRKLMQTSCNLEIFLENDVKAAATAESIFGKAKDLRDFLMIHLGTGIGAALFSNGELLRGSHHLAGEIGHIVIDPDGVQCDCGRKGCLQATSCALGIEHQTGLLFENVVQKSKQGDIVCKDVLDKAANLLSQWVANMGNIYDPPMVILFGEMIDKWDELFKIIKSQHKEYMWKLMGKKLNIQKSDINSNDISIVAAAAIALGESLEPKISFKENISTSST